MAASDHLRSAAGLKPIRVPLRCEPRSDRRERLAESQDALGSGLDARSPPRPIRPSPRARWPSRFAELTVQRLWSLSATPGPKRVGAAVRASKWIWRIAQIGCGAGVRPQTVGSPPAATAQDGPMSSSGSPCRNSTRSSLSPRVRTTSTRTEARAATRHAPRPQAVPRAAVTQIVAAVVM